MALSASSAELLQKLGVPLILKLGFKRNTLAHGPRFHVIDYIVQQSPKRPRVLFSVWRGVDFTTKDVDHVDYFSGARSCCDAFRLGLMLGS